MATATLNYSQEVHVHVRNRAWRNILLALALVALALPLALSQTATPASAQTVPPSAITDVGCVATPALIASCTTTPPTGVPVVFNTLGTEHTATFECLHIDGCGDVTASVSVASFGAAATIPNAS